MRIYRKVIVLAAAVTCMSPAGARTAIDSALGKNAGTDARAGSALSVPKAPGHLECVPYARVTSGIDIYGDAHTWWEQARTRYATGRTPRVGAVMAIRPYNNSRLGHVATVSRIVDTRTVLLSHANWSNPGKVERNVTALDVSPNNDWSRVRIWYAPAGGLGTTHWPVSGFIYNARPGSLGPARIASAATSKKPSPAARSSALRRSDPIGLIIANRY